MTNIWLWVVAILVVAAHLYHEIDLQLPARDESGIVTGFTLPLVRVDVHKVAAIDASTGAA